jgi:hypothetical protein
MGPQEHATTAQDNISPKTSYRFFQEAQEGFDWAMVDKLLMDDVVPQDSQVTMNVQNQSQDLEAKTEHYQEHAPCNKRESTTEISHSSPKRSRVAPNYEEYEEDCGYPAPQEFGMAAVTAKSILKVGLQQRGHGERRLARRRGQEKRRRDDFKEVLDQLHDTLLRHDSTFHAEAVQRERAMLARGIEIVAPTRKQEQGSEDCNVPGIRLFNKIEKVNQAIFTINRLVAENQELRQALKEGRQPSTMESPKKKKSSFVGYHYGVGPLASSTLSPSPDTLPPSVSSTPLNGIPARTVRESVDEGSTSYPLSLLAQEMSHQQGLSNQMYPQAAYLQRLIVNAASPFLLASAAKRQQLLQFGALRASNNGESYSRVLPVPPGMLTTALGSSLNMYASPASSSLQEREAALARCLLLLGRSGDGAQMFPHDANSASERFYKGNLDSSS